MSCSLRLSKLNNYRHDECLGQQDINSRLGGLISPSLRHSADFLQTKIFKLSSRSPDVTLPTGRVTPSRSSLRVTERPSLFVTERHTRAGNACTKFASKFDRCTCCVRPVTPSPSPSRRWSPTRLSEALGGDGERDWPRRRYTVTRQRASIQQLRRHRVASRPCLPPDIPHAICRPQRL